MQKAYVLIVVSHHFLFYLLLENNKIKNQYKLNSTLETIFQNEWLNLFQTLYRLNKKFIDYIKNIINYLNYIIWIRQNHQMNSCTNSYLVCRVLKTNSSTGSVFFVMHNLVTAPPECLILWHVQTIISFFIKWRKKLL